MKYKQYWECLNTFFFSTVCSCLYCARSMTFTHFRSVIVVREKGGGDCLFKLSAQSEGLCPLSRNIMSYFYSQGYMISLKIAKADSMKSKIVVD